MFRLVSRGVRLCRCLVMMWCILLEDFRMFFICSSWDLRNGCFCCLVRLCWIIMLIMLNLFFRVMKVMLLVVCGCCWLIIRLVICIGCLCFSFVSLWELW